MPSKKAVPYPSYSTSKQLLRAFQTLFKDLGEQDASIQMQEISQRFLEATSKAMGTKTDHFLKLLYEAHQVPHGTYDFSAMQALAYRSNIVLTYASFEAAVKEAITEYKTRTGSQWVTLKNSKILAPIAQVPENLLSQAVALTSAPEYRLIEYYRFVRIAESHRTTVTTKAAQSAYSQLTSSDLAHFAKYQHITGAPNQLADINFEDFKLFTRAVKYYCNLLNEALA